MSLYILYVKCL